MRILFLSTWFPYPLSKGSKTRAHQLLRALAHDNEVSLLSFEDEPIKASWVSKLESLGVDAKIVRRDPFGQDRFRTVVGWMSARPASVVASYSAAMRASVEDMVTNWCPDIGIALTIVTAPYLAGIRHIPRVVDVDNVLTRMLYESCQRDKVGPRRLRRWLASWKVKRYESWLFRQFDLCLAVSELDRRVLHGLIPEHNVRVAVVPNGVDTEYHQSGYVQPEQNSLVFNGALTYQPNYEAMDYFLREILPLIRVDEPHVKLRITGKIDQGAVKRLAPSGRVEFTGYLDDIRGAVATSWACVVPLRSGGGTRVKILEAMALGTPVITTSKGVEGLDAVNGQHVLVADSPEEFASQTVRLLRSRDLREHLSRAARCLVEEEYDWTSIGSRFRVLIEELGRNGAVRQ